jgi:hypothetical protein
LLIVTTKRVKGKGREKRGGKRGGEREESTEGIK